MSFPLHPWVPHAVTDLLSLPSSLERGVPQTPLSLSMSLPGVFLFRDFSYRSVSVTSSMEGNPSETSMGHCLARPSLFLTGKFNAERVQILHVLDPTGQKVGFLDSTVKIISDISLLNDTAEEV